jgi:hypothetical protein
MGLDFYSQKLEGHRTFCLHCTGGIPISETLKQCDCVIVRDSFFFVKIARRKVPWMYCCVAFHSVSASVETFEHNQSATYELVNSSVGLFET